MLRSRPDSSIARERLRALTPGWLPSVADLEPVETPQPAAASPLPDEPPVGGHRALPERRASRWGLSAAAARGLLSLGLAAVAGGLVVVVAGWPRGEAAPPSPEATAAATNQNVLAEPSATASEGSVVVDVDGRVRRPGVVELPAGSRVVDAIEAAGGVVGRADTGPLNLAQVLVDGEQVVVPARGQAPSLPMTSGSSPPAVAPGAPGSPVPGSTAPGSTALVSINTASATELETLPGIGPVLAAAIVEWRTQHGAFTTVEQLQEVSGIGPATFAELAPLVRL